MPELEKNLAERYQQAIDLYKKARLQEALEVFEQLGDYGDAKDYVRKCTTRLCYQVGNKVTYGEYKGEPIVWRVLEQSGNMCLLLSDQILDHEPYQEQYVDTSWRESTLRKWLNQHFLKTAFTPKEQMSILNYRLENHCNPVFFTNGGLNTADKCFCLSYNEAMKYLPQNEDRATDEWWWLRTPGSSLLCASAVYADGSIYVGGINANYPIGGVRPAMWVLVKV